MNTIVYRGGCFIVILFWSLLAIGADAPGERVSAKDGAVQIYVPGGEFIMGVDDPEAPMADEQRPPHPVKLSPFWMDKYEVTNEQFARFLNQLLTEGGKQWTDRQCYDTVYSRVLIEHPLCGLEFDLKQRHATVKKGQEKFPAMPIPWATAAEYAAKMGRRLPTEAEWEYAARSADGRRYPWGNAWNPQYANVQSGKSAAVDAFPKDISPFGIVGLAGNVREWVQDVYDVNYYASAPKENPLNSGAGGWRVIRGGSYMFTEWDARATSRYRAPVTDNTAPPAAGFRTAESPKP